MFFISNFFGTTSINLYLKIKMLQSDRLPDVHVLKLNSFVDDCAFSTECTEKSQKQFRDLSVRYKKQYQF